MKRIKRYLEQFRIFLIKKLITEDEKHTIASTFDKMINYIEIERVKNPINFNRSVDEERRIFNKFRKICSSDRHL